MLLSYLDTKKATQALLRDFNKKAFDQDELPDRISEIDCALRSCTSHLSKAPSHGGTGSEHRMEDRIAEKAILEDRLAAANQYFNELLPVFNSLDPDTRYILSQRYIESDEDDKTTWLQASMNRLHLSKASVYRMHDKGIDTLSNKLFWATPGS